MPLGTRIRETALFIWGTLGILREQGDSLHSRKLRSFDEPPFR